MKNFYTVLKSALIVVLIWASVIFIYAFFSSPKVGEAYAGSFSAKDFSRGWTLVSVDGTVTENVDLPLEMDAARGDTITLRNKLPHEITKGMRLCTRATMSDLTVKINGRIQGKYSKHNFLTEHIPVSSFLFVELYDDYADGDIELIITSNKNGRWTINPVSYAYGNNAWFPYIRDNLSIAIMAFLLIFVGISAIIAYCFFYKKTNINRTLLYLGLLLTAAGMWMVSESWLRQLIFGASSYASIFAYLLIETIAGFGAMYVDEIQEQRYNKPYAILVLLLVLQVLINSILNFTRIADYYDTLFFAHIWSALIILWIFVTIVLDIRSGKVKKYSRIAIGMLGLVVSGLFELVSFYTSPSARLGVRLGFGLLFLMAMTIAQAIKDVMKSAEERRLYSEKMSEITFGSIATAIDSKDPFSDGHSERVGKYACMIAEKVAAANQLNEEDLERIKFIGRMHDIGRVGVPDAVTNKNGALSEDERSRMQQHTVIGSEVLKNLDSFPGLKEGVRSHHERWDGRGYPDGLKGEEIPLFARILCLADSFDAMTSDRIYRKKLTKEEVITEIKNNTGTQFDPLLAMVVLKMIEDGELPC